MPIASNRLFDPDPDPEPDPDPDPDPPKPMVFNTDDAFKIDDAWPIYNEFGNFFF